MIGQTTIASLQRRVRAVLDGDGQAEGELVKGQSRRRLFDLVGQLGRGEAGPLFDLIRSAGIGNVFQALPPDIGIMVKTIMSSGFPRGPGAGVLCSPRDPRVAVPSIEVYDPLLWQTRFHLSGARYRTAILGRRAGKTRMMQEETRNFLLTCPSGTAMIVAPTFGRSEKFFSALVRSLPGPVVKKCRWSTLGLTLINDATIECRSAMEPQNLRGEGLGFLGIDEGAYVPAEVFNNVLLPSLEKQSARAVFVSTPKAKGDWLHACYLRGLDPDEKDWASFQAASWANDKIFSGGEHDVMIEEWRRLLPADSFRVEIQAEFLDGSGQVFRGLDQCLRGPVLGAGFPVEIAPPNPNRTYYLGADLGRLVDFTALVVVDDRGIVCYVDRINKVEWKAIRARIVQTSERYNGAKVILDSTGLGDVVEEDLRHRNVPLMPVKFTNESKSDMVQDLAVGIESGQVVLPRHSILLGELESFTYSLLPSGRISYSAPAGLHDDLVCGLMLSYRGLHKKDIPWSAVKMGMDCQPGQGRADITSASWIMGEIKRIEGG